MLESKAQWIKILANLAVVILMGCNVQPTINTYPTAATTSTLPSSPSDTPLPTSSASADLVVFSDPTSTVQIQIPAGWQATSVPGQMKGTDGLVMINFSKVDLFTLDAVCTLRANDGTFGDQPQIQRAVINGFDACIVVTSLNRAENNGSLLVIDLGTGQSPFQRYLQVYADPLHFDSIVSSITLLIPTPAPLTPMPMQTPASQAAEGIKPAEYSADGLTLEEYPVVSAAVDNPLHFEFRQRISDQVFTRREKWRGYGTPLQLEIANQTLTPFGLHVDLIPGSSLLQIKQQGKMLLDQVSDISAVSLSDSGQRFAFFASTSTGDRYLVTIDGATPMDDGAMVYYAQPVFLGEGLLTLRNLPELGQVLVMQGDASIYHMAVPQPGVSSPIHAFAAYQGHWYLEVSGLLIRDGEILNPTLGASEIFGFTLLDGKPFYFYRQGNQIGMSYNGFEVTPTSQSLTFQPYNDVIHDQCCEPAIFNENANRNMIWFYALSNGYWYYVEVGIYP